MQTVDVLIGVFAVIAIVGSVAGAALYEPPAGPLDYRVTYATMSMEVGSESDGHSGTASSEVTLVHNVTMENITRLVFEITVSSQTIGPLGARTGAVGISVSVQDPSGTERGTDDGSITVGTTSTDLEVTVSDLNPVPEATTLSAASDAEAARMANETAVATAGVGDWTVIVTIEYPGAAPENGQVTSTATATHYAAEVQLETPDISPAA